MTITATEFKNNMRKYLDMVHKEDITITKNGKPIGVLVSPGVNTVRKLRGIISVPDEIKDMDSKEIKVMRLKEKNENND